MNRKRPGMSSKEDLKRKACDAVDKRKTEIIGVAEEILKNPETGFNEHRTASLVAQKFAELGIKYEEGLAVTGVKGSLPGGAGPGPRVAIIGELDSLLVSEHKHSDPSTGAAHACGHNAQIGMMLGAVIGLQSPEVLQELSGSIIPFAVPAEEFVEVERRLAMRQQGKLEFLGGKQELIRLGSFDDVDMAIMCHTASDMGRSMFSVGSTSNAHMVKYVQYYSSGTHPGPASEPSVNLLSAANLAIAAIHTNRETFRELETARVHGIIASTSSDGNPDPTELALEWRVRSSTTGVLVKNGARVDRCFKAGALAVGARVRITNIPGYLPLQHSPTLQALFHSNAAHLLGRDRIIVMPQGRNRGGSTDMGDLSQIMPVCHPYSGGATGPGHSKDYMINNYEQAVINPAKIMAMVVIDLQVDGASKAKKVLSRDKPTMTKDSYVSFQRKRATIEEFDGSGM